MCISSVARPRDAAERGPRARRRGVRLRGATLIQPGLSTVSKRNTKLLKFMTLWIIAIHYLDIHWIVMPTLHHNDVHLGLYDLMTMIGFGLIFTGSFK